MDRFMVGFFPKILTVSSILSVWVLSIIANLGFYCQVKNGESGNTGSRIKKVRMQIGLNQAAFAKKLSLSGPTVISKYERDQREPEIAILVKIAKLANKSLDWLLTGKSSVKQKAVEKKLGEIIAQVDRIYREGNAKKLSAVKYFLDMADPDPAKKKKD